MGYKNTMIYSNEVFETFFNSSGEKTKFECDNKEMDLNWTKTW